MGKRRKARESALQILFQLEFDNSQPEETLKQYWISQRSSTETKGYTKQLIIGITAHQEEIDRTVQSGSENWRISRMPIVDRNILRMAVFELFYEKSLAPAIVINEAIEIAKKFGSDKSSPFINGVLDGLLKKMKKNKKSSREDKNER